MWASFEIRNQPPELFRITSPTVLGRSNLLGPQLPGLKNTVFSIIRQSG